MDRAGDGGRNLPRLASARQSVGPFRGGAFLLLALGGLAVDYVLLDHRDLAVAVHWRGHCRAFSAQLCRCAGQRSPTSRHRARPQFRLCWRSIPVSVSLPARDRRFPGRDRPARAIRRRRDPCRGEYALWLFIFPKRYPRTAPDVRLAAYQPARRVANDARAARNGRRRQCSCWQIASLVYPMTWSFYCIAQLGWSPGMIGASLAAVGVMIALGQVAVVGPAVARFGERDAATLASSSRWRSISVTPSPHRRSAPSCCSSPSRCRRPCSRR